MGGWTIHTGQAVALPLENIDTDQLIPARFMSVPRAEGYGRYLLHDMRFDVAGQPDPDMVLNRHPGASILVTRRNFGCGSSREAAVYALVDAGFCAVIAPGFGDIFAGNAVNNGLLPARVSPEAAERLIALLGTGTHDARIDLQSGEITLGDHKAAFDLDPTWRTKLIKGWDDIDLTGAEIPRIAAFRAQRRSDAPWAWPDSGAS
ncbi:MAG: 3-isopropylmalate/(R)-2-methylmalate dehydratase small subunit [Paracoccaceae bacterium]|jgi:3-isopropylmalate/(R)-2-methylmalate dehydratase small subunit